jgi:lipoprotein-releasing system ATP-binding protein
MLPQSSPSSLLLETQQLNKIYPGIEPVYAVRDVSLRIAVGEFLSIVGPSGSGKSTLMNVLGLLDSATSGVLRYGAEDTLQWSEARKAQFRNEAIGFIFQAHLLLPEFTALENVLLPARIAGDTSRVTQQRAEALLERIGLGARMHFRPGQLSGGQNQRAAIARALLNRPKLVFADEPTGALDVKTGRAVFSLMRELNQEEGVTFIIVTHDPALSSETDRVIRLLDGCVESDEKQPARQ